MFLSSCQSFFFSPCGRGWGPHAKPEWVRASACFADGRGADPKNTYGHGLAEKIQLRQAAGVNEVDSRRLPTVYRVYSQQAAAVHKVYNQPAVRSLRLSTKFTISKRKLSTKFTISQRSEASGCLQSLQSAKIKSKGARKLEISEKTVEEIVEFINKKINIPYVPESIEAILIKAVILALFHVISQKSLQALEK